MVHCKIIVQKQVVIAIKLLEKSQRMFVEFYVVYLLRGGHQVYNFTLKSLCKIIEARYQVKKAPMCQLVFF